MKLGACILFFVLFLLLPKEAFAIYNPQELPNNRFGIHIIDENDLKDAEELVNSNGGEWGYITFVIQEDNRELSRWSNVFVNLRKLKLIPIVRVATSTQGANWKKPDMETIDGWVNFLDTLPWPIENRYVVVGNEPNHAKEWGGTVNPEEYSTYFVEFSKKLKENSSDFFVLPAGLDASAPNGNSTMDETLFIERMLKIQPDFFGYADGWVSHSYPNPNFSGSELDGGRGSVRTFEWELAFLKELGVDKDLPVFITETGWAHNEEGKVNDLLDTNSLGEKLKYTYEHVWNKEQVITVTPFIFSYLDSPFEIFSWKRKEGGFYSFYDTVKSLTKVKGEPKTVYYKDFDALHFLKEKGLLNQKEGLSESYSSAILVNMKSRLKFAKIYEEKGLID